MKKCEILSLDEGKWLLIEDNLPTKIIIDAKEAANYEPVKDIETARKLVGKMTREEFIAVSKQKGRTDNWINKAIKQLKELRGMDIGKNTLYEDITIPSGEAGGGYDKNIETYVFMTPRE